MWTTKRASAQRRLSAVQLLQWCSKTPEFRRTPPPHSASTQPKSGHHNFQQCKYCSYCFMTLEVLKQYNCWLVQTLITCLSVHMSVSQCVHSSVCPCSCLSFHMSCLCVCNVFIENWKNWLRIFIMLLEFTSVNNFHRCQYILMYVCLSVSQTEMQALRKT